MSQETPDQIAKRIYVDRILLTPNAFEQSIVAALQSERERAEKAEAELAIVTEQRNASVNAEASMRVLKESQSNMIKSVWEQHESDFATIRERAEKAERELEEAEKIIKSLVAPGFEQCKAQHEWLARRKQSQPEKAV